MTTMKSYFSSLVLAATMILALVACSDDDNSAPSYRAPELNAVSQSYEQEPWKSVEIQLNANAEAGISTVTLSGAEDRSVSFEADDNNQMIKQAFQVPARAREGHK